MDPARPPPRLWRSIKGRSPSIDQPTECKEGWTFGLKAPIVDFFGHDYITQFAPLDDILNGKADDIMNKAYKQDAPGQDYLPLTWSGYKFRWIHIPANNMVWVEEVIKRVCEAKAEKQNQKAREEKEKKAKEGTETGDVQDVSRTVRAADILSAEFWKDQQRGCLEHSANHPLYARHMVPFFAGIPTDWESKTASVVAGMTESENSNESTSKQVQDSKVVPDVKTPVENLEHANMVLFMPYLHWATSGANFDHRNAVIKQLAEEFKDPEYQRSSIREIEEIEKSAKMRVLRAFLYPAKTDSCLHIRRTLDQYYYSTVDDADERTEDQVVYKFAKKQHHRILEEQKKAELRRWKKEKELEEARKRERKGSRESSMDIDMELEMYSEEEENPYQKRKEPSWDPPKVMMVNQLWMWIVDGDTVITSFPSKAKSELSMNDSANRTDVMEGDSLYDSTDIWRAVQRELRHKTNYGQRTAKTALDLAWTIADQARGVFHKRNLHPHLQFIQMFEMEINEITFNQTKAFAAFSRNVQAAHNANNIGKLLASLTTFQKENFATSRASTWKTNFRRFALEFKRKLKQIARDANTDTIETPPYTPASSQSGDGSISVAASTNKSFFGRFFPNDSLEDESWPTALKKTYSMLEETIDSSRLIGLSNADLEEQILDCLRSRFTDLELLIGSAHTTESLNRKLNGLVEASLKSLDWYTEMVMDDLFNITSETNLVSEIKDILDELNIISCVGKHQQAVIEPFMGQMLGMSIDTKDGDFHDGTRLGNRIEELIRTAQSTYTALQDLLDLKQKQASVIEARSARRDAKASMDQAEASTSLAYETVKQGWSIMIFTIVTIIFLPLSFFTGLFGMNAKELMSGDYTIGFYSSIMYPISFVIICVSLGLALNTEFRLLAQLALRKTMRFTLLSRVWKTKFGLGGVANVFVKSIEREKRKKKANHKYKKWEV